MPNSSCLLSDMAGEEEGTSKKQPATLTEKASNIPAGVFITAVPRLPLALSRPGGA